jgi:N-acyl-D-aspartate/D-glutamate deacylase
MVLMRHVGLVLSLLLPAVPALPRDGPERFDLVIVHGRIIDGTGMWADITIFDPATVRDTATFEAPNQLSQGMDYVLVNGVPVIDRGKMTDALPGKVLRGPGYQP